MDPTDQTSLVNAYKSWTYVFANKNAQAVASVPLKLYTAKKKGAQKKMLFETRPISKEVRDFMFNKHPHIIGLKAVQMAEDVEEVLEHPFLDLMNNVNPISNRFDLWEGTQLFEELTGHAYWYILKDGMGVPQEIWLLPSDKVRIVPGTPDSGKIIEGYIMTMGVNKVAFLEEEVVMFKFPSLTSQFYGYSPLTAGADSYNTNLAMQKYNLNTFKNMGRVSSVLVLPPDAGADQDTIDQLRTEWHNIYGGIDNVEKTAILSGGVEFKNVSLNPKDLNYLVGKKATMLELANIFGVPMSKITSEDVNRANADAGERQYQSDTIKPRCMRKEQKINEKLMPMYDQGLFVMFDNPVEKDIEVEMKMQDLDIKTYVRTINDIRKERGFDPVPYGDLPLVPNTIGPLGEAARLQEQQIAATSQRAQQQANQTAQAIKRALSE
jgi:HK97 family phage portal protein